MAYYRVPVVEDSEGRGPDVDTGFSVLEYLEEQGEVVIESDEALETGTELSEAEVEDLVTNPVVLGAIEFGGTEFSFQQNPSGVPVGIDPDGVIRERKEVTETYKVVVDEETGETETRTRIRQVLGDRPPERPLTIRKIGDEWKLGFLYDPEPDILEDTEEFYYASNREFPDLLAGKRRRLGEVKKKLKTGG